MRASQFTGYLKTLLPGVTFYTGSIDKNKEMAIGIYTRGNAQPYIALGGVENTSFATLPISILVHWTENADTCESKAIDVYNALFGKCDFSIEGIRVVQLQLLDPCPINISRDERNIAEMIIRLNILYER